MKKLYDYTKVSSLLDDISVEKIYPLSITEKYQSGEIFVDDIDKPAVALFWHYCGFAFIAGNCTENIQNEIIELMNNPTEDHRNRLVIQSENGCDWLETDDIVCRERYVFSFVAPGKQPSVPAGCQICSVTNDNYELIKGNIIPGFSWTNKEEFLKNGFGYCLMRGTEVLACAFSAAVSGKCVDIGVETNEKYRGKGYGKIVASAMVDEILKQGKTPLWACDTQNTGSKNLACSVGFRVDGTHQWYKLR